MTQSLPPASSRLLHLVAHLVPPQDRPDWLRAWQAELWHARFGARQPRRRWLHADLSLGLTLDALWLRRESWRNAWYGTAGLCLLSLAALSLLAAGLGLELTRRSGPAAWASLTTLLIHALFAMPLVLFVACATGWHATAPASVPPARLLLRRVRRSVFLATKTALTLILAALLSADLFVPFYSTHRGTSDVLQELFFVLLALVGLRWSFADHDQRCKDCLRSLASPTRVGRPSHNLLEWNGTEQICRSGHGVLTSPEMISSWCQRSRWTSNPASWDPSTS